MLRERHQLHAARLLGDLGDAQAPSTGNVLFGKEKQSQATEKEARKAAENRPLQVCTPQQHAPAWQVELAGDAFRVNAAADELPRLARFYFPEATTLSTQGGRRNSLRNTTKLCRY